MTDEERRLADAFSAIARTAPPVERILERIGLRPPAARPRSRWIFLAGPAAAGAAAIAVWLLWPGKPATEEKERVPLPGERIDPERLADLARQVEEFQTKVDHLRGQGVRVAGADFAVPAAARGRIQAVDPEEGLAYLDLVETPKAFRGQVLYVYRGDACVGHLVVEELAPGGASARPLPGEPAGALRAGDEVASRAREEELRDLLAALDQAKDWIEGMKAQGIDVERLAEVKVPKPLDGKVVAVNADVLLVMMNLGEKEGVEKGMVFTVYRDNAYIGQVVVDQVYPDMASARIDPRFLKEQMKEGDDVTTRIR